MTTIDAEIVCFDGFDELDAIGPYEVLENGANAGALIRTRLVTLESVTRVTASHGLRIEPDGELGGRNGRDFASDLLIVPGGGWADGGSVRDVVADGDLPDAVASMHETGTTVASVCTGAMILSAAGLLEGRPATTHHDAVADLETEADVVDARVVDDGDILTAGGVTAGLDLALWVLEREFDPDIAMQVARGMAYDRRGAVVR